MTRRTKPTLHIRGGQVHTMAGACWAFIKTLEINGKITNKNLFEVLARIADKMGYELQAHQHGVQGTHIYFTKREDKHNV